MAISVLSDRAAPGGERTPVVAVVGGGCAGTLVAANLLRRAATPLRLVMIERSGRFGPGVAYATEDPQHLLNVPARGMSAFCDEPSHFADWASGKLGASVGCESYLPRGVYGRYLQELLAGSQTRALPGRTLELVGGEVVGVARAGAAIELLLADATRIACDRVVLATGPLESAPIAGLPDDPRVVTDPWAPGALHCSDDAPGGRGGSTGLTLILGTGLSGVDAALSTCARQGRVLALSRGGRFPYAHLPGMRMPAPPPGLPPGQISLAALERLVREHVRRMEDRGYDWRASIDGLRGVTPLLWGALPIGERRLFLRERARTWETRRHRMAPAVAARLHGLLEDGQMTLEAGSVLAARSTTRGLEVDMTLRPRGRARTLTCERVVLCTGTGTDIRRSRNPLLQRLLADGSASPDPLGLGLRTTGEGALLDSSGHADGGLFTLGALRRGELWETTAVQEIRSQAEQLANTIAQSLAHPWLSAAHLSSEHTESTLQLTPTRPSIATTVTEVRSPR